MINIKEIINDICDFVIKTVQTKSILTGFQYVVYYSDIFEEFSITLTKYEISSIKNELLLREEVADVVYNDNGFDVVLYTDYAPNYVPNEYEL